MNSFAIIYFIYDAMDTEIQVDRTWFFNHETQLFEEGPKLNVARKGHSAGLIKDSVTKENMIISSIVHQYLKS